MPIVSSASLAVCRDETFIKTFVATKLYLSRQKCLCRYKHSFVATKHGCCFCRDKTRFFFVSTKKFFSFYRDKHRFDATNKCLSRQNVLSWQKSYLWQLRPMIVVHSRDAKSTTATTTALLVFPKKETTFDNQRMMAVQKADPSKGVCWTQTKHDNKTKLFGGVLFPRRPSSPLTSSDTRLHPHFQQIPRRWHGQPNCKISRFTKHI